MKYILKDFDGETPTIVTVKNDNCALCGTSKEIQNKY